MNVPAPLTPLSDMLRQVAMVAEISTSAIGLTRTDKTASRQADQNHAAKDGAGKVVVNRFAGADELIKEIMSYQTEARANLIKYTSTWGVSKRRLLPNANYQKWLTDHVEINDQFEDKCLQLSQQADAIIAEATKNIGTYRIDLPTKSEIENAFSLSFALEPIPDASAFAKDPTMAAANEELIYQFNKNMEASYNQATQDAAQRLADPLQKLAERMEIFTQREKSKAAGQGDTAREGYFRDTIITNVHDIAGVFGALNVLKDPKLAAIAAKVEPFLQVTPDILRSNVQVREAVAARAKEIIADLNKVLVRS